MTLQVCGRERFNYRSGSAGIPQEWGIIWYVRQSLLLPISVLELQNIVFTTLLYPTLSVLLQFCLMSCNLWLRIACERQFLAFIALGIAYNYKQLDFGGKDLATFLINCLPPGYTGPPFPDVIQSEVFHQELTDVVANCNNITPLRVQAKKYFEPAYSPGQVNAEVVNNRRQ